MNTDKLQAIVERFNLPEPANQIITMGEGFINDTLLVTDQHGNKKYILQRKNKNVFPDVPSMMENIRRVSEHLHAVAKKEGKDPLRVTLTPLSLKENPQQLWTCDDEGEYWTMCLFIPESISPDRVESTNIAYQGGLGFGRFHKMLRGFDYKLTDPIKGFHNLRLRFEQWDEAVAADKAGRVSSVADLIAEIEKRRPEIMEFQKMIEEGEFPIRVTHNDTKISNILFDTEGKALCVIDLDTMMSATIFNDFGDAIRSYTNTGAEDDADLKNVTCSLDYYTAFTRGFLEGIGADGLTDKELQWLPFAGRFITFEQVLRFLMDYINGDTYYKISYPEHNLVRTRAQLRLLESMEEQYDKLCAITQGE